MLKKQNKIVKIHKPRKKSQAGAELDAVRKRLKEIALKGKDRDSVLAAKVLLREEADKAANVREKPSEDLLKGLKDALNKEGF